MDVQRWRVSGWRPNPFWLLREMFGRLHASGRGIFVSDGGHLENTGIYQLLKRRCRTVIAVDASTDPGMSFDDLATLKRYAHLDLGVEIDIEVSGFQVDADGLSRTHSAFGVIRYPAAGRQPRCDGLLVVVKSSLTGDEDLEVRAYRDRAPTFPHEPLLDQFFDERPFEAYRVLGKHAAEGALGAGQSIF